MNMSPTPPTSTKQHQQQQDRRGDDDADDENKNCWTSELERFVATCDWSGVHLIAKEAKLEAVRETTEENSASFAFKEVSSNVVYDRQNQQNDQGDSIRKKKEKRQQQQMLSLSEKENHCHHHRPVLVSPSHSFSSPGDEKESVSKISSGNDNDNDNDNHFQLILKAKVASLIKRVAPDEIDHVDELIQQFEGREEELIETLQTMQERAIAARQRLIMKSNAKLAALKTSNSKKNVKA